MIAIKNADGTLVPIIDAETGADRTIDLSLAHSQQTRAEIFLYEIDNADANKNVRELESLQPFGSLVLRDLPENPFGEVTIQTRLAVDPESQLLVEAHTDGMETISQSFQIPSLASNFDQDLFDEPEQLDFPEGEDLAIPEMTSFAMDDSGNLPELTTFANPDAVSPMPATATVSSTAPEPEFMGDPDFDSFDYSADPDFGTGPDIEPEPEPVKPQKTKPQKTPPARAIDSRPQTSLGQNLMRASAGLFVISLLELGFYFLLRLHLL